MSDWRQSYAGYDDEALTLIANPGLVRRALKLVPTTSWVGEIIAVGDTEVTLDGRGPAHGRCGCPTAGVCVHLLAAAIFVRNELASDLVTPETGSQDGSPVDGVAFAGVLREVLTQAPAALCRKAGISAVRLARAQLATEAEVTVTGGPTFMTISWPGSPSVRYVAGAGWEGMVSSVETRTRASVHLEALARVFLAHSQPWSWPEDTRPGESPQGPTAQTRTLTAEVRREIELVLAGGLSHLGEDAADRLADLALDTRLGGLPLLSRHMGAAAALLEGLAQHREDLSESETVSSLAQAWALARALDTADEPDWVRLCGVVRREYVGNESQMTLLPLGASWWVTPTGARGLSLSAWDTEAKELRTATTARPSGTDPGFKRTPQITALWGVPLSSLLSGGFRLDGPRLSADGNLSPTARFVTSLASSGVTDAALREVVEGLAPHEPSVDFGRSGLPVGFVATDGFGQVGIDEPQQQVVWSLPVAGGVWQLRQEITPSTVHRVDTLLEWEAEKVKLAYVLARRVIVRGQTLWEPATLFFRQHNTLQLAALDFPITLRRTMASALQKRWAMLRKRWESLPDIPALPRTPVLRACDDIRDILVDLSATGRLTPSTDQRLRLSDMAVRFEDLALGTLGTLTRRLVTAPSPAAILSLQLVADRVALLASTKESVHR